MPDSRKRKRAKLDEPVFRLPPYTVQEVHVSLAETVDWGQKLLGLPALWKATKGKGVKVAVLDTGWDQNHPDLQGAVVAEKDFTRSPVGPHDRNGHGTHVAGTIGARENDRGVVGGAPECELIVAKVLGDGGSGSTRQIADGIRWALAEGADVISMSLGAPRPSRTIHSAVKEAVAGGEFFVCAAGNEGPSLDTVGYPAGHPECVAVGAIDPHKKVARFSSRGAQVDIVAPGVDVLSCYPPRNYAKLSGTSMATPQVTSVVALMLAKHRLHGGKTPVRNQEELLDHLRRTAVDLGPEGFDPGFGFGLIDPAALLALGNGAPHGGYKVGDVITDPDGRKLVITGYVVELPE